jgi:ribosomal protein S12 methylthiotransferase accessory factor
VVAAVSCRTDDVSDRLIFGFGAHVEARIAIERALTEMTQSLGYIGRTELVPDNTESEDDSDRREALAWWQGALLAEQPYLAPNAKLPMKTSADYLQLWSEDLREDVEWCVSLAMDHGLETLVLDQTRPDIGLSVVKVIVPGLRHFWRRLAPGRLYDVPVQLGWLPAPRAEGQLNPISIFL